ncbi:hypothetical protein [Geobacillus thermoleovorans]
MKKFKKGDVVGRAQRCTRGAFKKAGYEEVVEEEAKKGAKKASEKAAE